MRCTSKPRLSVIVFVNNSGRFDLAQRDSVRLSHDLLKWCVQGAIIDKSYSVYTNQGLASTFRRISHLEEQRQVDLLCTNFLGFFACGRITSPHLFISSGTSLRALEADTVIMHPIVW